MFIITKGDKDKILNQLKNDCMILNESVLSVGVSISELQACYKQSFKGLRNNELFLGKFSYWTLTAVIVVVLSVLFCIPIYNIWINAIGTRCIIPNNYLIWEATRPVSNCDFCKGVNAPIILHNITRSLFKEYAYTSRPVIIKGAAVNWPAKHVFNFSMFRSLYQSIPEALDGSEPCQFLHFKSNFVTLKEVFEMSDEQANFRQGTNPWYVGWSNCHPDILKKLRKYYPRPHFLPEDSEMPNAEYVFFGYEQGAVMHLDYIPRLMWQAQLQGHKDWSLAPTPECDHICSPFNFSVEPGDAVLVDTRVWYHGTNIHHGDFSITVQSEYG